MEHGTGDRKPGMDPDALVAAIIVVLLVTAIGVALVAVFV